MDFDPIQVAAQVATARDFEHRLLEWLAGSIGYDVAFTAARGASATAVGLDADRLSRALRPGSAYEREMAPVKQAALSSRGVAVDTDVLGRARVRQTAYFRHFVRPLGGTDTMMGYCVLRGRVIGGLMMGRAGNPFRPREIAAVERLLPALAVARASFGLAGHSSTPLPSTRGVAAWPWGEHVLARREDREHEILVRDRRGYREMVARDLRSGREMVWTRAALDDPSRSGWPYVDLFHVAAGLARRRERALFIGCGGAVGPRQFASRYPGVQLDVVESSKHVVELARSFYALDEIPELAVHVADGESFVQLAEPCSWDVVIVDAYEGDKLGTGLTQRPFFSAVKRALRPGGAMAFNVVGSLDGEEPLPSVVRAAGAVFDEVRVVPVMTADETYDASAARNVVVVGVRTDSR